jgi:hypothetical protein
MKVHQVNNSMILFVIAFKEEQIGECCEFDLVFDFYKDLFRLN